jgi:hypothetical protein
LWAGGVGEAGVRGLRVAAGRGRRAAGDALKVAATLASWFEGLASKVGSTNLSQSGFSCWRLSLDRCCRVFLLASSRRGVSPAFEIRIIYVISLPAADVSRNVPNRSCRTIAAIKKIGNKSDLPKSGNFGTAINKIHLLYRLTLVFGEFDLSRVLSLSPSNDGRESLYWPIF